MTRQKYTLEQLVPGTAGRNFSQENPLFFSFRQKEVIRLAPDCVVFINGDPLMPVCSKCGKSKDIRNDIASVSVTATTGGTPPTCTIEIQTPRHDEDKYYGPNGRLIFSPMQEVRVYMKGFYFLDAQPVYYPVFWGMITSVVEGTSTTQNVELSCVGMLHWWEMMQYMVNPGAVDVGVSGIAPTAWMTKFKNRNSYEIIYMLTQLTMANASITTDLNRVNVIREPKDAWTKLNRELIEYWQNRLGELESILTMFGVDGTPIALDRRGQGVWSLPDERLAGMKSFIATASFTPEETLGKLGPFGALYQGSFMETQQMSLLEIANQVKQFTGFEFFQQMDGNFWFKPPFYNMDVRSNNPWSILDDKYVVSWNLGETEDAVVTRLNVTGSFLWAKEQSKMIPHGYHVDYNLAKKFGMRAHQLSVGYLRDAAACQIYAAATMSRINARVTSSSVTLVGRPELRLGFPVYIPARDSFYYVTGITHSFSFGGPFQTTLSLEGRRQKRFDVDSNVMKNVVMKFQPGKTREPPGHPGTVAPADPEKVQKDAQELENKSVRGVWAGYWKESMADSSVLQVTRDTIPVTDEEGRELIGGFPYGRDLVVDETGAVRNKVDFEQSQGFGEWLAGASRELDEKSQNQYIGLANLSQDTFKKWEDKTVSLRYGQYLHDTREARSLTNPGVSLAEMTPDDEAQQCVCVPEDATFEQYLQMVTAGLARGLIPQQDVLTPAARTERDASIEALQQQIVKDESAVEGLGRALSLPMSSEQRQTLQDQLAETRTRLDTSRKQLESLDGSAMNKPARTEEIRNTLSEGDE